jgi:hypothetical protein
MEPDAGKLDYAPATLKPSPRPSPFLKLASALFVIVGLPLFVFGLLVVAIGLFGVSYGGIFERVFIAAVGLLPIVLLIAWGRALKQGWNEMPYEPRHSFYRSEE